jgi:hypothetical protein
MCPVRNVTYVSGRSFTYVSGRSSAFLHLLPLPGYFVADFVPKSWLGGAIAPSTFQWITLQASVLERSEQAFAAGVAEAGSRASGKFATGFRPSSAGMRTPLLKRRSTR